MNNLIGIERRKAEKSVIKLNILLADYDIFCHKIKNLNWNKKGKEFFELHEKLEKFYNDVFEKIDEISERILTIECNPLPTYGNYLATMKSRCKEIGMNEQRLLQVF